jgi:hypothetical protein
MEIYRAPPGHFPCVTVFACVQQAISGRTIMNKDRVKGVAEQVTSKITEGVGKMTNDPSKP